mgnify:FL=1
MKGCFTLFFFLFTNLLFCQNLYDLINNKLKNDLFDKKEQIEGKLVLFATDFSNSVWVNPEKIENIDTLINFDEDINLLLSAISLRLFDNEKFNINSYLTAIIPGSTEPYLPNSDDYDIPFKQEMTAKYLIQQRSGIYNLFNNNKEKFLEITKNDSYIYNDSDYILIIDSLSSFLSKNNFKEIDPNLNFNYNKLNFLFLSKVLNRISGGKLINALERNIYNIAGINNFTIENKISPYLLALYYKNIIKNEMVIPKRLMDNYLLSSIPINNFFIEYTMGCFYYKNIGYGNISLYDNSARLTIYIPTKNIFLLFYIFETKINNDDFLLSKDINKLLELLSKINFN